MPHSCAGSPPGRFGSARTDPRTEPGAATRPTEGCPATTSRRGDHAQCSTGGSRARERRGHGVAAAVAARPEAGTASSHREAPLIAEDPTADNTDLYAFRSPDQPDTVTIISNWIPAEDPAAGPNYYTFSPSARYNVHIDRTGDAWPDIVYRFRFGRTRRAAFLGNTVQSYTVDVAQQAAVRPRQTPPNNIGPRSTPNYRSLVRKRSSR